MVRLLLGFMVACIMGYSICWVVVEKYDQILMRLPQIPLFALPGPQVKPAPPTPENPAAGKALSPDRAAGQEPTINAETDDFGDWEDGVEGPDPRLRGGTARLRA